MSRHPAPPSAAGPGAARDPQLVLSAPLGLSAPPSSCGLLPCQAPELLCAFALFLQLEVARGSASPDTLRGYCGQARAWVAWCCGRSLCPAEATAATVKAYRHHWVSAGYRPATIAYKLAVVRRFYAAAVAAGLCADNPALGVWPPRDRQAAEALPCLSEGELGRLLSAVAQAETVQALRDRLVIALLGLHGLRTVEVWRANVEDLHEGEGLALLVRGKGRDRLLLLRPDVAAALRAYLQARGPVVADAAGTPLVAALGCRAGGQRLGRRGVRRRVDGYLRQAGLKRPGLSAHAPRATRQRRWPTSTPAILPGPSNRCSRHADPRTTAWLTPTWWTAFSTTRRWPCR